MVLSVASARLLMELHPYTLVAILVAEHDAIDGDGEAPGSIIMRMLGLLWIL